MEQKITALKVQKRNPNRVSVYLDGEFAFGVSKIVAVWLRVGQELSEAKIASLQAQETLEVAYQQALHFLSYRPRSEQEVAKKLYEKGFDDNVVSETIKRLQEDRFLGDEQFAKLWVENRSTFRPRSHRLLKLELRQKGISDDHIQSALAEAGDESKLALDAAIRYARRLANLEWDEFRKRLGAYLLRRGFSYGTINPILRQVWSQVSSAEHQSEMEI